MHYNSFLTDKYLKLLHPCADIVSTCNVLPLASSICPEFSIYILYLISYLSTSLTPILRLDKTIQNVVIKNTFVIYNLFCKTKCYL